MKLLEAKGAEAMELIGDLFDPISNLAMDTKIVRCIQTKQFMKAFKFAFQEHPKDLIQLFAVCEGIDPKDYNKTAPEMLDDLMTVANHPIIQRLFFSQAQETDNASFGSATEITQAGM